MTLTERIERICKIHADCLTIASRLGHINEEYLNGTDPDQSEVKRLFERLELREAALPRHTAIAHYEASQAVIVSQVGGGDKDSEYP